MSFQVTSGNTDDRIPVKDLVKDVFGKIYGDKGYISAELFEELCCTIKTLKGFVYGAFY